MGMLIKGMGADHVVWGTDALWTGAPQWQIEGLRRLEIPEDMRKKHGFAELGPADGPVKRAIFGEQLGQDVPLRRQEGGVARRSLRRHQVGLRARAAAIPPTGATATSFLRDRATASSDTAGSDRRLAARLPGVASPILSTGRMPGLPDLATFSAGTSRASSSSAPRASLVEMGPVLAAGIDLLPLSLTAFADPDVERRIVAAAEAGPGRLGSAGGHRHARPAGDGA